MTNNKKHSILNLEEKQFSPEKNSSIARSLAFKLSNQANLGSHLNRENLQYLWKKLWRKTPLPLLTLTSAILICTGGEAIAQVCPPGQNVVTSAGNADSQNVTSGTVLNPDNALGVPDTNVAQ